jgi:hypothetical protein
MGILAPTPLPGHREPQRYADSLALVFQNNPIENHPPTPAIPLIPLPPISQLPAAKRKTAATASSEEKRQSASQRCPRTASAQVQETSNVARHPPSRWKDLHFSGGIRSVIRFANFGSSVEVATGIDRLAVTIGVPPSADGIVKGDPTLFWPCSELRPI